MNALASLIDPLLPEIILVAAACALFLMGVSAKAATRRLAPLLAIAALIVVSMLQLTRVMDMSGTIVDVGNSVQITTFAQYVKLITALLGILFVLLAWPGNADGTASASIDYGPEAGEFFGLMLLSLAGVFLVAGANDIMMLFLAIELASIPTYIMVSISRPLAVAQEAGIKYFFLGAMAAAVMLFGFSYLYGATGATTITGTPGAPGLTEIMAGQIAAGGLTSWEIFGVVFLVVGFAFKLAAVPMHVYAADVYQGAATPVTAFLSYVPKASGLVALLKILYAAGGGSWNSPEIVAKLIWVLAVLTMTFGNVLGLIQYNVKRVLAYSSIAHTGYMLTGVATLLYVSNPDIRALALTGILFYIAAYGLMNVGIFGVLILLPSKTPAAATSAERFDDIAGKGRTHVALGLAMAIACFSLTGLPFTVGFFAKFMLLKPAFEGGLVWLPIITLVNAAISAAYYLKIVNAMFMRTEEPTDSTAAPGSSGVTGSAYAGSGFTGSGFTASAYVWRQQPVLIAVAVSSVLTVALGTVFPATQTVANFASEAQMARPVQANITASALPPADAR